MMASVALVLLFLVQPFLIVVASNMPSTDGGTGAIVPIGARATYYPNHPRLLVRDKTWAGGLSVADLSSRCQVGTSWWNRCNIIETTPPTGWRLIPTYAMRYLLKGNGADADQAIVLMKAMNTAASNVTALADLALGFDWVYNYTSFSPADKTTIINKLDALSTTVLTSMSTRHIWSRRSEERRVGNECTG
jgi:hypothetical protein